MGHVVWLWSVPESSLGSCVVLQGRLRQAAWHPSQACLLMLTHSTSIFLWTPQACASPDHSVVGNRLSWLLCSDDPIGHVPARYTS